MKARYLKSSTTCIETKGVKILTDPWLVDGEYYGSWFHYPAFDWREDFFKDVDFIYCSHIHPDHFSKGTFAKLDKSIPVLIHTYESKFLKMNIERLGFEVRELPNNVRTHLKNGVYINILAADNCNPEICARFFGCAVVETKFGSTQIDSLCVIDDGEYTVMNTNDCPFALAQDSVRAVKEQYKKIDLLFVGYGGAGPYPQCFEMTDEEKVVAAEAKKKQFLGQGLKYLEEIKPKFVIPFAGTYVLGGRLWELTKFRGVPEIEDAAAHFTAHMDSATKAVLLNSWEYIDLSTGQLSKPYIPQDLVAKEKYIREVLASKPYDYDADPIPEEQELKDLILKGYERFDHKRKEIDFHSETFVLIKLKENNWAKVSCKGEGVSFITDADKKAMSGYVAYTTDLRLLKWILMGPRYAHWNNAEVGSHLHFERVPNIFERGLYYAICYFHA